MKSRIALFGIVATSALLGCGILLGVEGDYTLRADDAATSSGDVTTETSGLSDASGDATADGGVLPDAASDGPMLTPDVADVAEGGRPTADALADVAPEAAADAGPPLAFGPTPGHVNPCGFAASAGSCTTPSNRCCYGSDGGYCQLSTEACNLPRSAIVECDEAADCSGTGSDICCLDVQSGDRPFARCKASCPVRICRADAECPNSEKCLPWPCPNGPVRSSCNGEGYNPALCF
ncbi:MAG: hypothetical protein IPG50_08290 [Myxococcales bacterium]|nr:hypothetical protein [Myxococcales bacterium]